MLQNELLIPYNPIDVVEQVFNHRSFELERRGSNEVVIELQGKWKEMLIFFAWEENLRCLQISCFMDIEITIQNKTKIFELLALANADLWLGHFSYWAEQNMPVYKHSIILNENRESFEQKIEQMINLSINECERMYPIFYAVLTKGVEPRDALFPSEVIM